MQLKYIVTAALALSLSAGYAQKQTPPEGGQPKDFTLPAKETGELENGMAYTLVPFGNIPKTQVSLVIKTGNIHEEAEQVWLSDLMADLMQEGTTNMKGQALREKVARMGGELYVSVGMHSMTIGGSVLAEHAQEFIGLIADVAMNPAWPESELERLKADMKRSLSIQSARPQSQAQEKFMEIMYPGHAYGRMFPTEAMIENYTLEDIKAFYQANVGAKRSHLYAVGMMNEGQLENAVQEAFNSWQAGPAVSYPEAKPASIPNFSLTDRSGAPQSTIMLGLPVIDPQHPDYVKLMITNTLLGGSFGSRITSNIREDKGYTYSPRSTINTRRGSSLWYEVADVTTEHTGASLAEISKEINRLKNEAPSEEELKGIQNYQAGVFVLQNSSPSGIASQLAFLDIHDLPEDYLTKMVERIHAVTPEDVQQMTDQYLDYDNMSLVVVGDKVKIEEQLEEFENKVEMQ